MSPVGQILGPHKLIPLAIQHVLVMYAGAAAELLIISGALGLLPEFRALPINSDLLAYTPYGGHRGYGLSGHDHPSSNIVIEYRKLIAENGVANSSPARRFRSS